MATIVKNKKRFKVIKLSRREAISVCGFGFFHKTVLCDNCNKILTNDDELYYVAVLDFVFCKECYKEWYAKSKKYDEDAAYEKKHFDKYKSLLAL